MIDIDEPDPRTSPAPTRPRWRHRPADRPRAGRTSGLRFVVALTPLLVGASVLLAGSAAGLVSVAFAGQVPITVHAAHVSGSNVTAAPGASGRGGLLPALVTRVEKGEVTDACTTSTAQLPVVGAVTVTVRIERASADGLTVESAMATAESVTLSGAHLDTPQTSPKSPTGLFSVGAEKVTGRGVTTRPHAFTAGTITASGVDIAVDRGSGGCRGRHAKEAS
ncbi:hypothetical protein I2W78_05295 [Streptomyces spinoverrucosus]|uniref:DUF6230 family protein n=1 Tax=Streptomyces spinoverrucosus TaxID=284043 RepID=UPI0018C3E75E|nr:DUF6230 family protein [Streptomyces spinoverrucosus]MBG0851285.1 hypothetical protein [Streptomyces spinoverrucosus]